MRSRLVVLAALTLAIAACASSEPAPQSTSDSGAATLLADPPWGLDTIEIPDSAEAVAATLINMPLYVDDVEKTDVGDGQTVTWEDGGRTLQIRALPLSDVQESSGSADMTPTDFLTILVESGEMEAIAFQDLDDEDLVMVVATGRGDGVLMYTASWADPSGGWIFSVTADTPEARTDLVHAFVNVKKTSGPLGTTADV